MFLRRANLCRLAVIGYRHEGHCLLLRFHELTYEGRNVIGSGIEREVSSVEQVNVGIGYILAVTFWLPQIERKIVLAPDDQ